MARRLGLVARAWAWVSARTTSSANRFASNIDSDWHHLCIDPGDAASAERGIDARRRQPASKDPALLYLRSLRHATRVGVVKAP